MKTMCERPRPLLGAVLALGILLGPAFPGSAGAQIRQRVPEAQECRCVDRNGRPIADCSCLRLPPLARSAPRALSQGRVRLGITLAEPRAGEPVQGAEVASVMKGGPADKAGIREGDVITRVKGRNLLEPLGPEVERTFDEDASLPVQRLMEIVKGIEPGEKVEVEYLRGGARSTVTVEARDLDAWSWSTVGPEWDAEAFQDRMQSLGERLRDLRIYVAPGDRELRVFADSSRRRGVVVFPAPGTWDFSLGGEADTRLWACPGNSPGSARLWVGFGTRCPGGLELVELKPSLAEYFGATRGVLVADVHPASKLGLRPGDVILAVGEREATDPDRVRRILASYASDETVPLRILRQRREITVSGTLGK